MRFGDFWGENTEHSTQFLLMKSSNLKDQPRVFYVSGELIVLRAVRDNVSWIIKTISSNKLYVFYY